jgi:hypothetical protein
MGRLTTSKSLCLALAAGEPPARAFDNYMAEPQQEFALAGTSATMRFSSSQLPSWRFST